MPKKEAPLIARITKTPLNEIAQIADLLTQNGNYLKENFPQCSNQEELLSELRRATEEWYALLTDQPLALFTLHIIENNAVLDKIFLSPSVSFQTIAPHLKGDFGRMRVQSLTLRVPEEMADDLAKNGCERKRSLVRLKGPLAETKLMPILPLRNPSQREIQMLAKLMHDSYEKSSEPKLPGVAYAEKLLRETMSGSYAPFSAEASFTSCAGQNVVSACLVTLPSPVEAEIMLLFTHPLYRARGLATTEVATSMNALAKRGVQTMKIWLGKENDIAIRLFTKLGFKRSGELVEMAAKIP